MDAEITLTLTANEAFQVWMALSGRWKWALDFGNMDCTMATCDELMVRIDDASKAVTR